MNTTEFLLQAYINDNEGKIEAALAAIDEGSYGICKVCQKEIQHERLEMMPTSLTCMDHADGPPMQ